MGPGDRAASARRRENPNQQQALNDLAYVLATEKAKPEEALTFAKRAYGLPNAGADVADTLAWVYHLLGQNAEAEPLVTDAAKQRPDSAEIHWHAAAILAGTGNPDAARRELDTALRLDSTLGNSPDVQKLRDQLPVASKILRNSPEFSQ
jgi:Flp pilus assembly protein TadD